MTIFQRKVSTVFSTVFVLALLAAGPVRGEGNLVAKVGSVPITKYELLRAENELLPMSVSFHGGMPPEKLAELRKAALEKLIERAYKVQYAIAEEIAGDNAYVEGVMSKVRAKFKTDKDFAAAAGEEGVAAFRASVYRAALAKKAEELAVDSKVVVSDEQVRESYDKSVKSYMRPKQFKASHILIRVDPSSNKEERAVLLKKAEDLLARAKAGEDFYNLAYYNSDDKTKYVGGSLGYFHEGQTVPQFNAAILKMKPGEVSDLVETMYGYHIIRLDEVDEARQLAFDEVKDKIRASLESKVRQSLYTQWMDGLKSKYQVQRFDP